MDLMQTCRTARNTRVQIVTLIGWLPPINTEDSPLPYNSSVIGYAIVLHSLKPGNSMGTFHSARGRIG